MSRKGIFGLMKGFIGLFVLSIMVLGNSGTAKAEDMNLSGSDVTLSQADNVDMEAIMSALCGRTFTDDVTINVNDNIRIECKITEESTSDSESLSKSKSLNNMDGPYAAAASSTTKTFTANFLCYFNNVHVVTITHSVTVIYFDTGLVHISAGSFSASSVSSSWTTSTYGYSINNTNGSASSATGTAKLTCASIGKYALYYCTAAVIPGYDPSFSFTQI